MLLENIIETANKQLERLRIESAQVGLQINEKKTEVDHDFRHRPRVLEFRCLSQRCRAEESGQLQVPGLDDEVIDLGLGAATWPPTPSMGRIWKAQHDTGIHFYFLYSFSMIF